MPIKSFRIIDRTFPWKCVVMQNLSHSNVVRQLASEIYYRDTLEFNVIIHQFLTSRMLLEQALPLIFDYVSMSTLTGEEQYIAEQAYNRLLYIKENNIK